jgi:SAM-dependent methyltransferase
VTVMQNPFWFLNRYNTLSPKKWGFSSQIHLDMGCGNNPRNPFDAGILLGADIMPNQLISTNVNFTYINVGLDGRLSLRNNSVDSISGYDFIEHLPRGATIENNFFIKFMNEAYRILKLGGILLLVTPAYPSPAAFQDPTHVNFITKDTVNYFAGANPYAKLLGYGFEGYFRLIHQSWVGPISKVWETPTEQFQINKVYIWKLSLFIFINKLRSFISGVRKPTHLIWILQKISPPT